MELNGASEAAKHGIPLCQGLLVKTKAMLHTLINQARLTASAQQILKNQAHAVWQIDLQPGPISLHKAEQQHAPQCQKASKRQWQ